MFKSVWIRTIITAYTARGDPRKKIVCQKKTVTVKKIKAKDSRQFRAAADKEEVAITTANIITGRRIPENISFITRSRLSGQNKT